MANSTTITMTLQDIRTSSWDLARYMLWRPLYAIPTAIFLAAGVVFIALGVSDGSNAALIVVGAGLLIMTLMLPSTLARQARRNFSGVAPAGTKFTLGADEKGLSVASSVVSQTVKWNLFRSIKTVGKTVVIRQHNVNAVMMLPLRAFSEDALRIAREHINAG